MHRMNKTNRQSELPLTNETLLEALPQDVKTECRQLLSQTLLLAVGQKGPGRVGSGPF